MCCSTTPNIFKHAGFGVNTILLFIDHRGVNLVFTLPPRTVDHWGGAADVVRLCRDAVRTSSSASPTPCS
jgi:hypothetical protein